MNAVAIYPQLPLHFLQSVRFVHALTESLYEVAVPSDDQIKFRRLAEVFDIKLRTDIQNCQKLNGLAISHQEPRSSIGSIHRTLIFPHAIVDECKMLWDGERAVKYSFAGLITPQRRAILQEWITRELPGASGLPQAAGTGILSKLLIKVLNKMGRVPAPSVTKAQVGDLLLWSSTRGRKFPEKAWDAEYYKLLATSSFVLCPSGDFTWSYRFFEAIMCGAIPIVEDSCEAYEGFQFYTMQQPLSEIRRTEDMALENYLICRERITIPHEQLNLAIGALINT